MTARKQIMFFILYLSCNCKTSSMNNSQIVAASVNMSGVRKTDLVGLYLTHELSTITKAPALVWTYDVTSCRSVH